MAHAWPYDPAVWAQIPCPQVLYLCSVLGEGSRLSITPKTSLTVRAGSEALWGVG